MLYILQARLPSWERELNIAVISLVQPVESRMLMHLMPELFSGLKPMPVRKIQPRHLDTVSTLPLCHAAAAREQQKILLRIPKWGHWQYISRDFLLAVHFVPTKGSSTHNKIDPITQPTTLIVLLFIFLSSIVHGKNRNQIEFTGRHQLRKYLATSLNEIMPSTRLLWRSMTTSRRTTGSESCWTTSERRVDWKHVGHRLRPLF